MSDYIITNGQLHSTDELMHWKYIKRERKNGKWVYYYDKESAKRDFEYSKLGNALGYDEQRRRNAAVSREVSSINALDAAMKRTKRAKTFEEYQKARLDEYNARIVNAKAHDKYKKADREFRKTPIGKLTTLKEKIDSGKYWIENLFKK